MDPFALVLFGGLAVFVAVIMLIGHFYPGSAAERVGLKSGRDITETREALEAEDLDQLVAARNARRRARGQAEMSAGEVELQVARELGEQEQRRKRYAAERRGAGADLELEQLLAATNARRRARGAPERSPAQAREEFKGAQAREEFKGAQAPEEPGRAQDPSAGGAGARGGRDSPGARGAGRRGGDSGPGAGAAGSESR